MPIVAPWLQKTNVLGALTAGGQVGSAYAQIKERAKEARLNHEARMAGIAAQNAATAARTALAREQMATQRADSAALQEARDRALAERRRQFDIEQSSPTPQKTVNPWSGPVQLRNGRVVQVNQQTGEVREAVGPTPGTPTASSVQNFYKSNPAMQDQENKLLADKAAGVSGAKLMERYPAMFKYEPFRTRYVQLLGRQPSGGAQNSGEITLEQLQQTATGNTNEVGNVIEQPQPVAQQGATNEDIFYDIVNGGVQRVKK